MRKGIMGFFLGGENNKQKIEGNQNHTKQSSVTESSVVVCSSCGAKNIIFSNSECEYCGSPIVYITDGKILPSTATDINQNTTKQNSDLSHIEKTYTLTTGFYTAGIDIPIGTCNVTAISGSGNLNSSDYEINEVFGMEHGDVSSFKGLKLPKDVSLSILGKLTIKIVYKLILDDFSGRTYDISCATDISTGNYVAGSDFKAGIYNIVAVSGTGNLTTGDCEVNEVFGLDEEDVHEIKNVYLPKGAELSLEGDLSVKLIPALQSE